METWVALAVTGAFLQNLRSALQRRLTGRLAVLGATYARFAFAAPFAAVIATALVLTGPGGTPGLTPAFFLWALTGAVGQIAGQVLLLRLFSLRNFAVGNAFARTETIQAAVIGAVLIGDRVAVLPALGILVSALGVMLLSVTGGLRSGRFDRATALTGIASGAGFALSGVAYRAASLAIEGDADFVTRAAITLAVVTFGQAIALSLWMRLRAPGAITGVFGAWRAALPVGVVGMCGSFAWFAAFTLAPAAEVKAVGQIELLFSMLTARLVFGERPSRQEITGITLVGGGIVLLVLAG